MPYTSFHAYFREIAEQETRTMTILREDADIPKVPTACLKCTATTKIAIVGACFRSP